MTEEEREKEATNPNFPLPDWKKLKKEARENGVDLTVRFLGNKDYTTQSLLNALKSKNTTVVILGHSFLDQGQPEVPGEGIQINKDSKGAVTYIGNYGVVSPN